MNHYERQSIKQLSFKKARLLLLSDYLVSVLANVRNIGPSSKTQALLIAKYHLIITPPQGNSCFAHQN